MESESSFGTIIHSKFVSGVRIEVRRLWWYHALRNSWYRYESPFCSPLFRVEFEVLITHQNHSDIWKIDLAFCVRIISAFLRVTHVLLLQFPSIAQVYLCDHAQTILKQTASYMEFTNRKAVEISNRTAAITVSLPHSQNCADDCRDRWPTQQQSRADVAIPDFRATKLSLFGLKTVTLLSLVPEDFRRFSAFETIKTILSCFQHSKRSKISSEHSKKSEIEMSANDLKSVAGVAEKTTKSHKCGSEANYSLGFVYSHLLHRLPTLCPSGQNSPDIRLYFQSV